MSNSSINIGSNKVSGYNLGTGATFYTCNNPFNVLNFKSISTATPTALSIVSTGDTIIISANTSAAGQSNTASNIGGGYGLFSTKVGVDLRFRSLTSAGNVSLFNSGNNIVISGQSATATAAGNITEIQYNGGVTGGTLEANSAFAFSANTLSLTLGNRSGVSGSRSFVQGLDNTASGAYSHAQGRTNCAIGTNSIAQGCCNVSFGINSFTAGCINKACAPNSTILGGNNNTIAVGNTGAAIIGGSSVNLTGSSFINTAAVSNLAIITTPTSGSSNQVLIRNTSTGKIEYVSKTSIGGGSGISTANNGLTKNGSNVRLGGTLTGDTTVNTNNLGIAFATTGSLSTGSNSFAFGCNVCALGDNSFSYGLNSVASGCGSHAGGKDTVAGGDYSIASGILTCALNFASNANGGNTKACGAYSHSQNVRTIAFGCASHSGGNGTTPSKEILACGITSFNHSQNNASQTAGHGALAPNSAILGGLNHNIASGNSRAVIVGGNLIKLTGTSYIDTTAVGNLAIITTPTSGSSNQVLIRNTSTGKIEYVSKSSIGGGGGISTANNGLTVNGSNVRLGGTLTGKTKICTNNLHSLVVGHNSCANGINSFATGLQAYSNGANSFASGCLTRACGCNSHAEGIATCAIGYASHSEGNTTKAYGNNSHTEGYITIACGIGSHAEGEATIACGGRSHSQGWCTIALGQASHAGGRNGGGAGKEVLASGGAAFNHSCNDVGQTAGHGALADQSAILGGQNHNIASGNVRAAIIGGCAIKLTGTSYIDTTAVARLALMSVPVSGSSNQVLIRNTSTGKIEYVSKSSLLTSPSAPVNSIQFNNAGVFSGTSEFKFISPTSALKIGTNIGGYALRSLTVGTANCLTQCNSVTIGNGNIISSGGGSSIAIGYQNCIFSTTSISMGSQNISCGFTSVSIGQLAHACNANSFALGAQVYARAAGAMAIGNRTISCGTRSFAGGLGFATKEILAAGYNSFIFSQNNNSQTVGHGALAPRSAILGGINHNIAIGNTGATIIGGNLIKLTGTTYVDTTAVGNLAIMTAPPAGGSEDVLTWNPSNKKVNKVTQLSLQGIPSNHSNVAYVSKNGNDGTGAVNNISKPYLTINAALTAANAISGKTNQNRALVYVQSGLYTQTTKISMINFIDIYLSVGTTITPNSNIILFEWNNIDANIFGYGNLLGITTATTPCVNFLNQGTLSTTIKLNSINLNSTISGSFINDVSTTNNKIDIDIDKIIMSGLSRFGVIANGIGNTSEYHLRFTDWKHTGNPTLSTLISLASGSHKFYLKGNKVDTSSFTNTITFLQGFGGSTYIKIDDYVSSKAIFDMRTGEKIRFGGKITKTTNDFFSAIYFSESGGTLHLDAGTVIISASVNSIAGVAGSNIYTYGNVYSNKAIAGTITNNLGTFNVTALPIF